MLVPAARLARAWRLAAIGVVAVAILIAAAPILAAPGWPKGSDGVWFTVRTEVIAQRFALGDFLPVWSALDNQGFGSPMPANDHKLYNYLAALLHLATGSHEAAATLALLGFLAIGAGGMTALARRLGIPLPLAVAAAAA